MFKKLRNKFIITNVVISTIILVISFSAIFFTSAMSRQQPRGPMNRFRFSNVSQEIRDAFDEEIKADRDRQLSNLAVTLVLVGIFAELLVFAASYYIAEKSIEPVKNSYKKQQEFIANASHELKTPIAAAQANFEALNTTEQPWTDNVEMELDRASKLVNDMLTLARAESSIKEIKLEDTNLSSLIKKRTDLIRPRLSGKTLIINCPEKQTIKINSQDFTQLLDIILDNAVKYSKERIEITLREKSLTVLNDGKGIPKSKLPHIFDRFYQTDKTSNGVGLGLAIAKSIADKNGWGLFAESENHETSFNIKFN